MSILHRQRIWYVEKAHRSFSTEVDFPKHKTVVLFNVCLRDSSEETSAIRLFMRYSWQHFVHRSHILLRETLLCYSWLFPSCKHTLHCLESVPFLVWQSVEDLRQKCIH
jgi:hypothetical protein